jgi:hypothetical protein
MKTGLGMALCAAAGVLAACLTGQAQAGPAAGAGAGEGATILATGGSSDNKTDVLWVMTKVRPVKGPERMVLAMYKVDEQGRGFSLKGVRMLDADLRCVDLQTGGKAYSVNEVLKALPKDEADALRPPASTPERP